MIYSAITTEQILMIVLVVALIGVLVIMPIFTNKKRQQTVSTMYNSLKIGDKIMTIGGIIGTIKAINQPSPETKEIVLETGVEPNKTTMILDIKSLLQIIPTNPAAQSYNSQTTQANADIEKVFESESTGNTETTVSETVTGSEEVVTEVSEPAAEISAEEKPAPKPVRKTNSTKK